MQNGDLLQDLHVTDLTVAGAGVARVEGRVVFIEGALPGSVVQARVTGIRKGTVQAVQHDVVTASPFSTQPWCPHFQECGACLWQHFSLDGARAWKTRHVAETLARIGGVKGIDVRPILASPLEKEFRNKMAFAFGGEEALQLGLRPRNGKGIVPVTHCRLQGELTMRIVERVRLLARELGLDAWGGGKEGPRGRGYLRFLVVRVPQYRPDGVTQTVVECITGPGHDMAPPFAAKPGLSNRDAVQRMGEELMRDFSLTGFVHSERAALGDVAQGERRIWTGGEPCILERFGPLSISVPYNAFLQTNTGAASLLYEQIAHEAGLDGTQRVWDLYSGVGAIALYIAGKAREVHGFESAPQAVQAARHNSGASGMGHCIFHEGALNARYLSALPPPDVIIADPPRSGIETQIIDALNTTPAQKFLYISCDVATQARDIKRLSPAWEPVTSIPVDMFPHTPHVENMVVLNRVPG